MNDTQFGKRLKELRKKKRITQVELAEILNISKGTVAMWETGKRETSYSMLQRISKILDASIDYLLTGKDYEMEEIINEELYKSVKQKSLYNGFMDIIDLKKVQIKLHKFFEEHPGPEQRVLTIGLGAVEKSFVSELCLSDVSTEEGYLTGINICCGKEINLITQDEVLLFWIDMDELTDAILGQIDELNLNDLLYRTIIRFFENGGKLDEQCD